MDCRYHQHNRLLRGFKEQAGGRQMASAHTQIGQREVSRWLPQDKGQELAVAQHKSIKHDITAANSQSREDFLGDGLRFRCVQPVLADVHIFDMLQTACLGLGSQGGKVSAGEVKTGEVELFVAIL